MRLSRLIKRQLAVFAVLALVAMSVVFFGYLRIQNVYLGHDRYSVKLQLPEAGGLYKGGNVTYRGVTVGRVDDVYLTDTSAEALLRLDTNVKIPADLKAEVHSVSAVGEQYVDLLPQRGDGPTLKNGDVIPANRTSVPPGINSLLAAANRGLDAIPGDSLNTVIDESYTAFGGLGPELSRLVNGTTTLAIDAHKHLDSLLTLIDQSQPVLDSQTQSSDSVHAWAAHLATITKQLQRNDSAVQGILQNGPATADAARQVLDRLQPTLPIVLANLVSIGNVAVTYRDNLEGLLVLIPRATEMIQAVQLPNLHTKQDYRGGYLDFNLNLNWPPPCMTGFFPIQQMRSSALTDYPDRPDGLEFCRVPQDSPLDVRGLRNLPCETRPGKRAPTVKLCESDEEYVPLNDGFNWKGDPNATLSGQGVPYFDPGEGPPGGAVVAPPGAAGGAPPPPSSAPLPIATAEYDPATGTYVGPGGQVYTSENLAPGPKEQTWQEMLTPPPAGS